MKIGEVCLLTNDVKRLSDFYKWLLCVDNNSSDAVHQFILSGETALTIYNDGSVKDNNNQHIALTFTVEDVDAEYHRLLKMNITILDKPTKQPWGAKNMHFLDPDGNHLYFRSFPK